MNSYRLNDPNGQRTTEEAMHNIRVCTSKENTAKKVIKASIKEKPGFEVNIEDYGIDNSGSFIENDSNVNNNPDWIIRMADGVTSYITECCVHSEKFKTVSFKVSKLLAASARSSWILVVRENYYLAFAKNGIDYILNNYEVKNVNKVYGGKPSIILNESDIDYLINNNYVRKHIYSDKLKTDLKEELEMMFI